jgi:hypothetical protein
MSALSSADWRCKASFASVRNAVRAVLTQDVAVHETPLTEYVMARHFREPTTGEVVTATTPLTWLWQLLFSPIHFAYHRAWVPAIISIVAMLFTFGLSGIIFAFLGYWILPKHYLRAGWQELPEHLKEKATAMFKQRTTLTFDDLKAEAASSGGRPRVSTPDSSAHG